MLKEHPSRPPAVSKRKTTAVEEKSTANAAKLAATSNSAASSDRKQWTLRSTPNVKTKQIRPLSATSRTLNDNNKRAAVDGKNNKRPATVYGDNVTVRRTPHHHHHNPKSSGEELSRASSTSTLNAAATATSAATASKPKKVKDIDDKSAVETLRRELSEMAEARDLVALKLSSKCAELAALEAEIARLRAGREETVGRVEQLAEENTVLRNRLRDVAHSPLSDNEKQQLLFDNHHHGYGGGSGGNGGQQLQSSSAPASIATNLPDDGGGDHTACPTPEWDKQSSGNVSEVSVACLQDKINQMQETHYSTNEELQATLQELTDLQRQLYEHQQENVRLNDEKNLMFESLCRQTERLNDTRDEVESLKQLLYRHGNQHASDHHDEHNLESGHSASDQSAAAAERELKLVDLVRAAQEERESLLVHQDQLQQDVVQTRGLNAAQQEEIGGLRERVQTLESTLDAKHAEHKLLDRELALARDQSSGRQIEINRLKDVLESARTKINELEQDRTLADKSELDELLDNVRKEKDSLEADVTDLKEQLALSRNDNEKLREQIFALQEECKVVRNNARTTQCDLEYKLDRLLNEKAALQQQVDALEEAVDGLRAQTQCQQEDKRQLSSVLAETQRHLNESEARVAEVEAELDEMRRLKDEQEEEWEKFQRDLLTSVRVANDFKTEAQQDVQKLIMENKAGRERIKQLETQLEKLKAAANSVDSSCVTSPTSPTSSSSTSSSFAPPPPPPLLRPSHLDELPTRRPKLSLSRQNSRQSVKSLIESIENAASTVTSAAQTVTGVTGLMTVGSGMMTVGGVSRSDSASSIGSNNGHSMEQGTAAPSAILSPDCGIKTPLKEQTKPNKMNNAVIGAGDKNEMLSIGKTKSDTTNACYKQKSIEYSRRNSYSDLSERKDPLNHLVKNGGSKRNALLKWCQNKTVGYRNIDITNFSSSWNDGLALCALLHTYLPDRIPYDSLTAQEQRRNFSLAFAAAESVGIPTTLNVNDMIQLERPDWQQVMSYVTAIYRHFET